MARTYEDIKNRKREKEEKESKNIASSNESRADRITKKRQEKLIGFDTFESDLHTMGETLNNIYGSWQTKETMDNTFESVNKMYNRLVGYQDYYTQYGKESGLPDLSELLNNYKNAVDKWGERTELYGHYNNADAFNKAVKDYQLSEKFKGLSYDAVQARMRRYSPDSDEYKYLANYTHYSSAEDFDKAISIAEKDYEFLYGDVKDKIADTEEHMYLPAYADDTPSGRHQARLNTKKTELEANSEAMDEHIKHIDELNKAKNVYELDNGAIDKYKYLEQNEDFAEYSQYTPTFDKSSGESFMQGDSLYEYINDSEGVRDLVQVTAIMAASSNGYADEGYDLLYENEVAYYNYLKYWDRQNGTKEADKFLKDMKPALQKRVSDKEAENREEMLKNPFMATAFSLTSPIATIAGGVGNLVATGKDLITGSEYNPYDPLREISNANTHGREVVGKNIAEATEGWELFGQNIPSFLYKTGMSILDTTVGGASLGAGYTLLMGTNAYQQTAKDLTEQGYDNATVQGLAIVSGALEAAFEYVGFEHLIKLKDADSIGKVIYNALVSQGAVEGMEELGTSLGTIIAEAGFLGEDSQYMKMYNDLIERGFSSGEASSKVATAIASELGWSFVGGYLSGAGLGAGVSYVQYKGNVSAGKDIRSAEQIGNVFDIASISPEVSQAYDTYTRYANKGINADNISDAQLGNLYNTMSSELYGEISSTRGEINKAKKSMVKYETARRKANTDSPNSRIMQKLDSAINQYTNAQEKLGKYSERFNKLSDVENSVIETKAKKAIEEKHEAEVKKLSSGVETSVMAGTDKAIEIKGIKDRKTLITSEGEVAFKDVELSEKDARLFEYARGMASDEANLYYEQYDGEADVEQYTNDFNRVVYYAQHSGFSENYILEHKGSLSGEQVSAIYENTVIAEARAKEAEYNKLISTTANGTTYTGYIDDSIFDYKNTSAKGKINWNSLNQRQRASVEFLKVFAIKSGMNLVFTPYSNKSNGAFDIEDNTIYVSAYAGILFNKGKLDDTIIPTAAHEITHWMEKKAPELYVKLKDTVLDALEVATGKSQAELISDEIKRLDRKHKNKKHTEKDAISEIVARACEDMLSMSKEGRKLFDSMTEAEQKTFKGKVMEIIENLKKWIDDLLSSYKAQTKEAKALQDYKDKLEEISKIWDQMLVRSIEVNQALEKSSGKKTEKNTDTDVGVRYSDKPFSEQVDEVLSGSDTNSTHLKISEHTPKLLLDLGLSDKPLLITSAHTKTALGHKINGKNIHNVSIDVFKQLPKLIQKPAIVMESIKQGSIVIFVNAVDVNNNPILCSIKINGKGFYNNVELESNVVTSVYGKDTNPVGFVEKAVNDNRLLYWDKKMSQKLFDIPGLQLPDNIYNFDSNVIIRKTRAKINDKTVNNDNLQFSEKEIIGESGTSYGIGVYLDSNLLTGLSDDERIKMVKEYVKEVGGKAFTAYDKNGRAVSVHIAKATQKFVNKNGKQQYVNKDLTSYLKNEIKQESVVLIDELVANARYDTSQSAKYPHGWVDGYGKSDWEYWKVYIQEKNKTVWEATLDIATSANGEKILYDIYPIEMVERSVTSDTTSTNGIISDFSEKNNEEFVNNDNLQFSDKDDGANNRYYNYAENDFSKQIEDYLNPNPRLRKKPPTDSFLIGGTPQVLRDIGFNALPMTINKTHIDYALNGTKDFDHEVFIDVLKKIPEAIKSPVIVMESDSVSGRAVVVLKITAKNGKKLYAPIEIDGTAKNNGIRIDSNAIASLFGKGNVEDKIKKALNSEAQGNTSVFYWNKKEAISLLQRGGLQLPTRLPQDGFVHSIREKSSKIKVKLSDVTESLQFKRWFGDWQKNPKKASKVVDKDGKPLLMYHGTNVDEDFTVFYGYGGNFGLFGIGSYFTDNKSVAQSYTKKGKGNNPRVYEVYLNIKNPLDMDAKADMQKWIEAVDEQDRADFERYIENASTNEDVFKALKKLCEDNEMYREEAYEYITSVMQKMGYDGITHIGGGRYGVDDDTRHRVYITFEPEQVKSATDNIGTFDMANPNIQYSDKDDSSVYDFMGETENIVKENKKLGEDVGRLKAIIGSEEISNSRFLSLARYMKKISGSNIDSVKLGNMLKEAYKAMQASESLSWRDISLNTHHIATSLMTEDLGVSVDYFKRAMLEIRKEKISLSAEQRARVEERFGSYQNFHKYVFGRTNISKDGKPLTEVWGDWSKRYPSLFESDVNSTEQIDALIDAVDILKSTNTMMEEYERAEAVRHLSTEIYNQFWNVASETSSAEKAKSYKAEHKKTMDELRTGHEQRQKALVVHPTGETALKYESLLRKAKETKKKEVAKAKEHGKQKMNQYKENAERKTRIQSITSNALKLNEMLVKNSKDKHIPEVMKGPVINLLNAIDFSSKRLFDSNIPTQKDISLAKALSKVKDMMKDASNGDADLVELYGHGLDDNIKSMMESVDKMDRTIADNEFILQKMSLEDLMTLDNIVKTIKASVSKMNKFHIVNHAKGVANLSQESMVEMDKLGKGKVYDGWRGKIDKTLMWNNTIPVYAFKRYGEGAIKVFEALQDGWDKFAFNVKTIMDHANDTYTSKEVQDWEKEVKSFDILVPRTELDLLYPDYKPQYQKVQMTVPQIMSLYCLQKREQAKGHLIGGGIRVADFTVGKEVVSQSDGIVFTENDIDTIIGSLTSRQIEVADKLQKFMNTVCSDWGNDVSMARFGYKAFGEENYFPIQSDKNNLAVDDETEKNNSLFRLLNMSFAKSLTPDANNRIVISNIFDVFAQHTSDMAKYNALALPVLDAFRWYNYTEKQEVGETAFKSNGVKQSMEKAFGKDGQSYFTTFLKDINGQKEVSRDTLGSEFFSNAKIASVGANLRVVLLQPTSYVRASAVIDNKYLTKALAHKPKIKKAEEYCGIALWKSMGYYDTNVQRGVAEQIKHNKTWKDKATDWSMKGAEMADKVTWGYLWNACELEVRDKRQDLEVGSKEFFEAVSKRLREVIYATQVVDSTMTRSQMMRSSQFYDKMLTAFASEPTLAYNMVLDAFEGVSLDARKMGKKEALKKNSKHIARVLYAYTMTNAVAALVESAFDAYRDDDDEEMDLAEFMKLYLSNFAQDMSLVGKIPYIKDMVSMFRGYGASRTDIAWMQSLYYATTGTWKIFTTDDGNPAKVIKNWIKTASYLSGLPFYNLYRDTKFEALITELLEDYSD